ncbi:HAD family hydrolase [Egicoccus halophilus]|uniref:Morphological differentiation-associated protein n=1 Tax=Egicoccus halophilus TaxID=1670830 RepID=A0A8J3AF66_9ACTN|nr:HAD-IB family hydrolase [Egicoccus halophilus]GGI07686.1 morphological differentiation-associated protein [Egicoccus halophilus]
MGRNPDRDRHDTPTVEGRPSLDRVVSAAAELVGPTTSATDETEQRYARPDADRLGEAFLQQVAAGRTGASEAAFFDLDKTIIAGSSTLVMGRTLLRDGLISSTTVLKTFYAQAVYQLVGADHDKMEQMRHAAIELTRGWEAARVRRLVRETMETVIAPLAYAEALDLITRHQRAGRDVWIVSSSGEEIVEPFANYLEVRDVIATRSGIDDTGCYDGTLEFYAYAGAKATAIRQVAEVRGYDLDRCFAYSDSITDLPMLTVVGNPVAVNPDRELRAAATAMSWAVRDFHAPVRLRDRLPEVAKPRNEVLAGAVGAMAVGFAVWRFVLRGDG